MKAATLGALALLVIVPRLCALVVTQSATFELVGALPNPYHILPVSWQFAPFNANLGQLQSVTVRGFATITVTIHEGNPFPVADPVNSDTEFNTRLTIAGYDEHPADHFYPYQYTILPPLTTVTTVRTLTNQFSTAYTNPEFLEFFRSGTQPIVLRNNVRVSSWALSWTGTGNAELSLDYIYAAPDHGSALAMLAAAVGILLVHRRRMI